MGFNRKDYNDGILVEETLIPPDEPVFLLRAQDIVAVAALKTYRLVAGVSGVSDDMLRTIDQQVRNFEAWPTKKVPDVNKNS